MDDRPIGADEARVALSTVAIERQKVVDEIDLPRWYWWGLALGWVALGVLTDVGNPVLTTITTLAFGAVHAGVASRVLDGRHRTGRLSVSVDVAGRGATPLVIGSLLALAALTVILAVAADADGARHPVTMASIVVAALILAGGPRLLATTRRRAARTTPA